MRYLRQTSHTACQKYRKCSLHSTFYRRNNLTYKSFLTFSGFQIWVVLAAVIAVKILHQSYGNHIAVGLEVLFVYGLKILPRSFLDLLFQIESKICAADILAHWLLLSAKAGKGEIFITFSC